jgi:hypothetical protein
MGTGKLLGILIGLFVTLAVSVGIWHFYNGNLKTSIAGNIAQETAHSYDTFAGALNSYVHANFNNNIAGQVTCATLQKDNFLSSGFSCTDPIGETLSGYVSSPWGFPQSWAVAPSTAPEQAVLSKFNINNALQWKSFTYMVAQDAMNENQNFKGYSVSGGGNQLIMPDSDTVSDLSNYFPSSNVEFPQAMPTIAYYGSSSVMVFPSIQKNPAYWIFGVSVTEDYNTASPGSSPASLTYTNYGSTTVCPTDGLMPVANTTDWEFNSESYGAAGGLFGPQEIPGQTNYYNYNFYLCIPAAKSMINTTSNIFSNIGPVTSLNYNSDEVDITGSSTTTTTYSCPNGGTLSGTSCTYSATSSTTSPTTTYTCPNGGTLSGTTCSYAATASTASGTTTYSCPNGGTLSGSTCTYSATADTVTTPATYNGDGNTVEYAPPQVGRVYYIKEGTAKYTFLVFWSAFSSGYYYNNSGSYDLVWGQYAQAAAVLWTGEPSSSSSICVESSWQQPATEVSPEAYPPCWNAVSDLGLTDINLE